MIGWPILRVCCQFLLLVSFAVLKIGDVVKNPNLMDQLACLDRGHSVVKNWKHLAYQLDIPHDIQKKFETPFELSPTLQLFQNLSTADPELNIEKLKEVLKGIHRNDIIKELKGLHFFKYFHCCTVWIRFLTICHESNYKDFCPQCSWYTVCSARCACSFISSLWFKYFLLLMRKLMSSMHPKKKQEAEYLQLPIFGHSSFKVTSQP